jgi:glycosyltransferase involved in cell wall biosynthesis
MLEGKKDVFLCHSHEDNTTIVRPLHQALTQAGISCWLDEAEIRWGESISGKIEQGLSVSRYLLVVLSSAFVAGSYPRAELRAMLQEQLSTGDVRVLPLLVEPTGTIIEQFPLLGDSRRLVWDGNPETVVAELQRLLQPGRRSVARVCFISSEYPPHVLGGLGVHVRQLTAALTRHVHVDVVLPSLSQGIYETSGTQLQLIPLAKAHPMYEDPTSWLRFSELAAQRIIRMADEDRPEVIHCHDWVTVLAGIKCRWVLKVPLVFHLHLPNRSRLCAFVENLGLICADLVTVNSEAMHDELRYRSLPLRCPVAVIKNGVDLDVFRPCADWPADGGYILFVGRLVQQKGVEHLLRAFYYVREKFPEIRLKIVGDGDMRPALEHLCANLMLADQVDFLGWRTGQDLVALYQKALVAAVPSIYEPFGMTALEALACQRPVVASRLGGLQENIQHGVTGYLIEPEDELELAQWLMALLSNPGLRRAMGEAGGRHVSQAAYTWPHIAGKFVKLYEDIIGSSMDLSIPREFWWFRDQIVEISKEMSPDLRGESNKLLTELFAWSALT